MTKLFANFLIARISDLQLSLFTTRDEVQRVSLQTQLLASKAQLNALQGKKLDILA